MARKVDKKSFRRRIDAAKLLLETGELLQDGGRAAKLYVSDPVQLHLFIIDRYKNI